MAPALLYMGQEVNMDKEKIAVETGSTIGRIIGLVIGFAIVKMIFG
jgi:uncharacterized membrane protein (Fun14 family)